MMNYFSSQLLKRNWHRLRLFLIFAAPLVILAFLAQYVVAATNVFRFSEIRWETIYTLASYTACQILIFGFALTYPMFSKKRTEFAATLPYTRKQVYFTTILTLVMYAVILITAFCLLILALLKYFGVFVDKGAFLYGVLYALVVTVYFIGIVCFTSSIAGTRKGAACVLILMLVLPQYLQLIVTSGINKLTKVIDARYYGLFRGSSLPRLVRTINDYDFEHGLLDFFFPLFIGILLICFAWQMMKRRDNSRVGSESILYGNKVVTVLISSLPLLTLAYYTIEVGRNATYIVAFTVLSILLYVLRCVSESKSPEAIRRNLWLYVFAVAFAGCVCLVAVGAAKLYEVQLPEKEEIVSFSFAESDHLDMGVGIMGVYFSGIRYSDEETIACLAECLQESKDGRGEPEDYEVIEVRTKAGTYYRAILRESSLYTKLYEACEQSEDYTCMDWLPEEVEDQDLWLSKQECSELFAVYVEEVVSLKGDMHHRRDSIKTVTALFCESGEYKTINLDLTIITPKSLQMYVDIVNQVNEEELARFEEDGVDELINTVWVELHPLEKPEDEKELAYYRMLLNATRTKDILNFTKGVRKQSVNSDVEYLLEVKIQPMSVLKRGRCLYYVGITQDQLDQLLSYSTGRRREDME